MKNFEVGERVQFVFNGKLVGLGVITEMEENTCIVQAEKNQMRYTLGKSEIAKLDQPKPQSEKVKKINEIMLELIHRKDLDILSDDDITRMLIEALDIVNTLDQPKPVVVPKFVAEWIEECKENSTLYECLSGSYVDKDEIQEWHYIADEDWAQYEGHRELVARAWLDGYVVEEEQKYYVKLPEPFGYLRRSKLHPTTYDVREASKYTKQEIKELDERYWAFAVPVEEVEVPE